MNGNAEGNWGENIKKKKKEKKRAESEVMLK